MPQCHQQWWYLMKTKFWLFSNAKLHVTNFEKKMKYQEYLSTFLIPSKVWIKNLKNGFPLHLELTSAKLLHSNEITFLLFYLFYWILSWGCRNFSFWKTTSRRMNSFVYSLKKIQWFCLVNLNLFNEKWKKFVPGTVHL